MLRTCIATVSLSGDLHEKIDAIAAAGFDGIEIFESDLLAYPAAPSEVRRMITSAGLRLPILQPFRDFEGLPEPYRSRAFERAERKFDLMGSLGTDLLLVCSNVAPIALGGFDRAADDLRELGERAAKRGLRIGFEALSWGRHVSDHRDAWEIVSRADHPAVGIVLDSFHTLALGIDLNSVRQIPGKRIFHVHLADAPPIELDLLSLSRHFRSMPGQGTLDVTGFLSAVEAAGYTGYVSLEIFNDQFRSASARQTAIDGRRSLIAAMDEVASRDKATTQTRAGQPLPGRAVPTGIDFIEFAADDATAPALAQLLSGLGFSRAERPPSKNVEWWRQGMINILINSAREGFAHTAFNLQGPCVCSMGLAVEDAKAAIARAEALLADRLSYHFGGDGISLPALRGIGASLIFLLDAHNSPMSQEEKSAAQTPRAGLLGIDHVSQSLEREQMLSAVLFYTSIFALERTPELEIADPSGLVQSQVVQTASGSVRIALNAPKSARTMPGRFLHEIFRPRSAAYRFHNKRYLQNSRLPEKCVRSNPYDP